MGAALMSSIGGLLGNALGGGGNNNAGFVAQAAPTQGIMSTPAAFGQDNTTLATLQNQQMLQNALNSQNGIQNQSNVYNQLQGVANGTGANPAAAMLNQATGQNMSQQAALMASQRGASANPALLARQAAMQGAGIQQQAVGQGATLQAQQSLNALGQAGNIAGQQVGNQLNAQNALTGAQQQQQLQFNNLLNNQNEQSIQNVAQQNQANVGMAQTNAKNTAGAIGGVTNAVGGALGNLFLPSKPAATPAPAGLAMGGMIESPMHLPPHLRDVAMIYHGGYRPSSSLMASGGGVPGQAKQSGDHKSNDTVPAMLSPGEVVIPKSVMESKDPVSGAAEFVAALQKQKGKGNPEGDFRDALNRAISGRKKK